MSKKICVIIPVYNEKVNYLEHAVNSVLNQTYKNIETVIVNDGSTDSSTLNFLNSLQNDKIKIINQQNKGLGGARNTGIEHAQCDYLGFLDSDDWLDNNFYEILVDSCETNNADIACGVLTRADDSKFVDVDKYNNITALNDFQEKMSLVTNGSVCSKLFKKSLFSSNRFIEKRYWEDNPVLAQLLLESKKVTYTNKVRYYYRVNQNSICLNPDPIKEKKRIDDSLFMLEKIYNLQYFTQENKNSSMAVFVPILVNTNAYINQSDYREKIDNLLGQYTSYIPLPLKNNFFENIFSIKQSPTKIHTVITIFGFKIKIKNKKGEAKKRV